MNRVQRKRTKGWRTPEGCRYVGRGTPWGNPFKVGSYDECWGWITPEMAVEMYAQSMSVIASGYNMTVDEWLEPLRKYEMLSCYCPLDQVCHVDILIRELCRPKPKPQQRRMF